MDAFLSGRTIMTNRILCFTTVVLLVSSSWTVADESAPQSTRPEHTINLLPNGDFESGTDSPDGWQRIDGLSSFWIDDPAGKRGKIIKFDSDVTQAQAYQWWAKIAEGASPNDAPAKQPTVEPKYDTLAGLDGVWYYSDPVPVEPGKKYWLSLDVKGPGILVWLVGYPEKPDTSFGADQGAFQQNRAEAKKPVERQQRRRPAFIHKYVWKGQMPAGGADEWKTYTRRAKPFDPTGNTPNVRYVRVLIFPFWPPATYYVDNVRLTEYESEGSDER